MKKVFISLLLIACGAGVWWVLSQSAQYSVKRWDSTLESVLRHSFQLGGISDSDVLSSVHELSKDINGDWVVHRISINKKPSSEVLDRIKKDFENAGARIEEDKTNAYKFFVKRGQRTYQEINFIKQ